jgi:hypothetical protein
METRQIINIINSAIDQALSNMHTATIAKITKVNEKTIDCKPVFNRLVKGVEVELPVFAEVPPIFLQGGSTYDAFPLSVGDYCMLFFTERCTDGWYNGQDNVLPLEYRMHDYSDGFALVGLNNLAGAITIPSTRKMVGDIEIIGDITLTGDINVTGSVTATVDVEADSISLKTHIHGGVESGGSTTSGPQ